jgi:flagellar motor component MotA
MGGALIKTIAGPIMRAIVPPLMTKIIDDSSLRREEKEAITNGITNYIGKQQYSVEEKRIILQKIDERMVIFD